jgi:hypothetical protein
METQTKLRAFPFHIAILVLTLYLGNLDIMILEKTYPAGTTWKASAIFFSQYRHPFVGHLRHCPPHEVSQLYDLICLLRLVV